ncbi:unnamed protein product, partial [marine sediment metagenome]
MAGQSLTKMVKVLFAKVATKLKLTFPKSEFNDVTKAIIGSIDQSPINQRFVRDVSKTALPPSTLKAVDIAKCYSYAIAQEQFFPIFTVYDFPEPYTGFHYEEDEGDPEDSGFGPVSWSLQKTDPVPGKYYIRTTNNFPLKGNGWYSHVTTTWALRNNIITPSSIIYQLTSQYCITSTVFQKFKDMVYAIPDKKTAKNAFNFFNGTHFKDPKTGFH